MDPELKLMKRKELALTEGIILWRRRVVISKLLRQKVLNQLHEEHAGIRRMKSLARSYVFWPGLDEELVAVTRKCLVCQEHQNAPLQLRDAQCPIPTLPWQRIHVGFRN